MAMVRIRMILDCLANEKRIEFAKRIPQGRFDENEMNNRGKIIIKKNTHKKLHAIHNFELLAFKHSLFQSQSDYTG